MKKFILISCIVLLSLATTFAAPISAPEGVDINASSILSVNQVRWLNGESSVVNMYGAQDGSFYLHGGNGAAQLQLVPGDIDTQYWYINPWSNTKGIKLYDSRTDIQNNLNISGDIYANNLSGVNRGDQDIVQILGANLGGLQVPANSTKYVGPFGANFATSQGAANFVVTQAGVVDYLSVSTASRQTATMTITVYLNNVAKMSVDVTNSATIRSWSNRVDTFLVSRGDKISFSAYNNSAVPSAQIGGISVELLEK